MISSAPLSSNQSDSEIARSALEPSGSDFPTGDPQGTLKQGTDIFDTSIPIPVIGLGGSAGSIAALQEFFGRIPTDLGAAFVVVVHLSPDSESQLSQILQTRTRMPVVQVQGTVAVERNHVYVIPPGYHLEMQDGYIQLSEPDQDRGQRVAVDLFFRTLATARRSKSAAVVLSGTDGDGAIGIKWIKENGGVTIAQDLDEAEYESMPRTAIETGMVDWILSVEQMASKLTEWISNERKIHLPSGEEPGPPSETAVPSYPNDELALREVLRFLHTRTGHDFSHYKRATVLRRIMRRLQVNSLESLPQYADFLRTHPGESGALLQDLLISVTNFFRDPEAFWALETHLGQLFQRKKAGDTVRVWVAGCATGEEAYSLVMLLTEYAEKLESPPEIQIFATDLDEQALRSAREGLYAPTIAADVSPERLRRFFIMDRGRYRIKKEVRDRILFAAHNLLKDSPFARLDLISCRNLLIYFDAKAQARALDLFHFGLNPAGLLFLGNSETAENNLLFTAQDKKYRIYGRHSAARAPFPLSGWPQSGPPRSDLLPLRDTIHISEASSVVHQAPSTVPDPLRMGPPTPQTNPLAHPPASPTLSLSELHFQMIEQLSPPSLLINSSYEIVHLSERAGRFLQFAGGMGSLNLLNVVPPEMRTDLRVALLRAFQSGENIDVPGLPVEGSSPQRRVYARVRPLRTVGQNAEPSAYAVVIFDEQEATELQVTTISPSAPGEIAQRLEAELEQQKSYLRAAVEQFETSSEELRATNEELQAMNEEQRSASEELEASREEIQAANEELNSLNSELKSKVEETNLINGDLQNLMASTDIATIFLSRDLRIKRYTPRAEELFRLIPTDTGRLLRDLRHGFEAENFIEDAEQVVRTLLPVEREVQSAGERWFLYRIVPYRTVEDKIDGVVLNFIDITARKQMEEDKFFLAAIVESSDDAVLSADFEGRITSWNHSAEKLLGHARRDVIGKPLAQLSLPGDLFGVFENVEKIKGSQTVETFDAVVTRKNGQRRNLQVVLSPVRDAAQTVIGVSVIARDVTQQRRAEGDLRQSEERLKVLIESVRDYAIFTLTEDGAIESWNIGAEQVFGYSEEEILGQDFSALFTPEDRESGANERELQLARREGRAIDERWHLRKDGSRFFASGVLTPLSGGAQAGFVKVARDLTEKKRAEDALYASEARIRMLSDAVPQLIWTNEPDGRADYFNRRWYEFSGLKLEESAGQGWQAMVHPDDAAAAQERWQQALANGQIFEVEFRLRRFDGEYRWHIGRDIPLRSSDGHIVGWFGTATDIEDLKHAQGALRQAHDQLETRVEERTHDLESALTLLQLEISERQKLAEVRRALLKRLVNSQEEERGRISRELHDNLGQYLTGILLSLQILRDRIAGRQFDEEVQTGVEDVSRLVDELMTIAHRQAWELRPAELDDIGLVAALRQYTQDWNKRSGIPIDFQAVALDEKKLPPEVATVLYRVVQEALTNVARHSKATRASVIVEMNVRGVGAIVEDNGQGFSTDAQTGRLGLLGMRERLLLVGGTLEIESSPGQATTLFARVPNHGLSDFNPGLSDAGSGTGASAAFDEFKQNEHEKNEHEKNAADSKGDGDSE